MKNSTIKCALIAASFAFTGLINAQKIAHLNFDSLVSLMPETKQATEAAQNFLKGLEQELVAMQTEMENKYKDYQEKSTGMSDLVKANKEQELQQLQTRIQEFQRQAETEYKRKQAELTFPIIQKANKGIEAVAKEGGYKYVLNSSPQGTSVLFSEPSDDILVAVKKKLETMPPATIPGASPAGTGGIKAPQKNNNNGPAQTPPQKGGK